VDIRRLPAVDRLNRNSSIFEAARGRNDRRTCLPMIIPGIDGV
jgi:hypothetical protein